MSRKRWLIFAASAGVALLLIVVRLAGPILKSLPKAAPEAWNRGGIRAVYLAAQLREVDKEHASLILSYDLNNLTDADYRLAEGSGVFIMSKLKSNGSLSQEEFIHLSYPVFLPARQRARLAVEISGIFAWPTRDDSLYDEKLREFVMQRLADVGGFVLFDEASRSQIDLPAEWEQLHDKAQTGG